MLPEPEESPLELIAKSLEQTPLPVITFSYEANKLHLLASSNIEESVDLVEAPDGQIKVIPDQLILLLQGGPRIFRLPDDINIHPTLFEWLSNLKLKEFSLLKIARNEDIRGILVVGSYQAKSLTEENLNPYKSIVKLANSLVGKEFSSERFDASPINSESTTDISINIASSGDLQSIFQIIHEKIQELFGDYSIIIALYDEKTDSIRIPYITGEEDVEPIDAFPLGEGLTSILIRTKRPLLLAKDFEAQAEALGAKTTGNKPKSWLGVPLLVEDQAIGSIMLQDFEKEEAFTEADTQTLSVFAHRVAGFVYNAGIVDNLQRQLFQVQAAAEIARDISSALNLDELLLKAINLTRERFDFYHASIFMIDSAGQYAVVREATGEAGAQMKRTGHKLEVGSKSVVGFVAGQGEPLVINDTSQDATHLPNPLLPATRSEAALPLKIGDRILGVLDVQSRSPFAFSPNEVEILQVLADQLAIAVNNTELFAETQEHLSQHRLLHHITTSAASGSTLDEALMATVEGLQVTLGGDRVTVLLSDNARKNLTVQAWVGYSEESDDLNIPFGNGITGWVAAHRKPLRINDVTQDARYIEVSSNTRSELAIPLIFRSDLLGVLNVESEQASAYTENDEEMLGTLAGSLAAIIANARLVDQIRKQAERERQLYEISSKIRRSTDLQTILTTTITELNRATGAHRTEISVGIPDNEPIKFQEIKPPSEGEE